MKKLTMLLLALSLLTLPGASLAQEANTLSLPEDSSTFSPAFAAQTLALAPANAQSMAQFGLHVIFQANYDKAPLDPAHTSAYIVGQTQTLYKGETRNLLVISIRGTSGGEWYSNFNCAPSQDNDTQFAENFLAAAQEIYRDTRLLFSQVERPLVLLTGYSRGAACANLLGLYMNAAYGTENVFVYTAATPTTVRGEMAKADCPNIFNLVNPCDVVTCMPPVGWGYARLGQDIVLPGDPAIAQSIRTTMDTLIAVIHDIPAYYNLRLSLTEPGESADGLTAYEFMQLTADLLIDAKSSSAETIQAMSPESDLAPLMQLFLAPVNEQASPAIQHMPTQYAALLAQLTQP